MSNSKHAVLVVITQPADPQHWLFEQVNELVTSTGQDLQVLCVLPPELKKVGMRGVFNPVEDIINLTRLRITQALQTYSEIRSAEVKVCFGKPFIETIRQAVSSRVALVIKAAGDTHWTEKVLGSDDMHLLRKCPSPVLLLRAKRARLAREIMVAVDFEQDDVSGEEDALNRQMLTLAARYFVHPNTHFSLVNVFSPPLAEFAALFASHPERVSGDLLQNERQFKLSELSMLQQYAHDTLSGQYDGQRNIRPLLLQGQAAQALPKAVVDNQVELLVMGTLARAGIPGLLIGNTAEDVIGQVSCDVLALKPQGFKTPLAL